jgi:hypothetical protein
VITLPLERRDRTAGRNRATAPWGLRANPWWITDAYTLSSAALLTFGRAFMPVGAGIGLALTAASDAIVGNASVDDAGVGGGSRSTTVQLGGTMEATILGSVLITVGSVPSVMHAIAEDSNAAFMTRPHTAVVVASVAALLALLATGERDADAI